MLESLHRHDIVPSGDLFTVNLTIQSTLPLYCQLCSSPNSLTSVCCICRADSLHGYPPVARELNDKVQPWVGAANQYPVCGSVPHMTAYTFLKLKDCHAICISLRCVKAQLKSRNLSPPSRWRYRSESRRWRRVRNVRLCSTLRTYTTNTWHAYIRSCQRRGVLEWWKRWGFSNAILTAKFQVSYWNMIHTNLRFSLRYTCISGYLAWELMFMFTQIFGWNKIWIWNFS